MPPIPSARLILTDLILQLGRVPPAPDLNPNTNPLKARPGAREIVVALEYLLPGGVMAALDVLDRRLVTRYSLKSEGGGGVDGVEEREVPGTPDGSGSEISDIADEHEPAGAPEQRTGTYAYYVRSAQPSKWPKRPPATYRVRPTAWFCSCPTFLVAAFAAPPPLPPPCEARVWEAVQRYGWVWGGRMLGGRAPPVCKHLLACVLVERCPDVFGAFVLAREMQLEEIVGLGCAGRGRG